VETSSLTTDSIIAVACGVVAAAVVGYFAIVLFKWLLKSDKMIVFIIYTAVLGLIVTGISIFEMLSGYYVSLV
jgi:undecaprenyl-diphosphatase